MRELAVDFGTSNTVAAVRADGGPPRLLLFDGWPVLPSAVLRGRDGGLVVGREALRGARLDPARFEPHPKERIDEGEVLLGDAAVPVVSLIAAVLHRVAAEVPAPDRVVLTHPADWYSSRRAVLLAAAREAGWHGDVQLVAEPVAAASQATDVPPGQAVAVFDMGGGTTDVAVLRRTHTGWDVLAEAGLPDFGGRDLDQLLLDHLGVQPNQTTDAAGRRAARVLAEDVRAGKEALSQYAQTDIPLPAPQPDAHLTRQELETLVEPALQRAVELLAETVGTTSLTAVHLVGGATRMPLVARLINERLGLLPTIVESPETSVALGALGPVRSPQWTPPPPPLPRSTPVPPPPPPESRKPPVAAITTAIVVVLLAAAGVTAAALLRPDTIGTAVAGPTPSAPPDNPAFRGDQQLIAFAGSAAGKADECVNVMGTASQGDLYSARNHVRCRFDVDGIAYFANYLSSDSPQTCGRLNEEFTELPGAQWLSEEDWTGGDLRGKSHDIAATSGNNVLWYTDTQSLCAFFGASTEQNPPMPEVRQAWEMVVGA
ncbi:Hsp70 family protein [Amycolatopsis sp. 195334CR]|uniref:Hsp70 family protein n=1 Tax=Amycolatopsis sp. 195334CR TaxID=2814588 RepID=UPI001A8E0798|nr:Hsp70 family protein [Amycolatopsis sp. 195334CR]MBN6035992.1 Hsp70 family protein [Amycolatopsis sp. 195334CR]